MLKVATTLLKVTTLLKEKNNLPCQKDLRCQLAPFFLPKFEKTTAVKRFKIIFVLLAISTLAMTSVSCQKDGSEEEHSEAVDDLLEKDQEKADSLKRALGIE